MPRINFKKIGEALAQGESHKDALVAGGYAPTTAQRGIGGLGRQQQEQIISAQFEALEKNNRAAIRLSEKYDTDSLKKIARGSLIRNAGERTDKGIQTIKTIAGLAETGMTHPDIERMLVIMAPSERALAALDAWAADENSGSKLIEAHE